MTTAFGHSARATAMIAAEPEAEVTALNPLSALWKDFRLVVEAAGYCHAMERTLNGRWYTVVVLGALIGCAEVRKG